MAFALRRRGDWERALSLLERSRELDPKNWLTWVELGFTNERMGRPQEALEAYRKSADLSERKSFVFMMMGMYEATVRGDLAPMRRTLDAMGPDNPDRPMGEMWYAHQLGDYAEALAWADKVPVAVISDDEIYLPLSLIRFNILTLMDSPDATAAGAQVIQDLEAVIAENPKDWRVRVAYGVALALAGRGDEAIREARLATDLMPVTRDAVNGERAMNDQAAIYLLAGREDEAAALFRERLQSPYSGLTPNAIRFDPRLHGSLDSPAMRSVLEPTP